MSQLSRILLVIIAASTASMSAVEVPQPAQITEVDIITKEGTFKRPVCHSNEFSKIDLSTLSLSEPLASYEDFQQIAEIQQRGASLLKIPIIPLNKKAHVATDAYFVRNSIVRHGDKPFCLLSEMSFDSYKGYEKRFFVGHEIGHLQKKYIGNKEATRDAIEISNKNCGQSLGFMLGTGIMGGLYFGGHKVTNKKISKHDPCIPMFITAVSGAFGFYLHSRYKGYKLAQPLHKEEFACDKFAVQTGSTPQEKIDIAQGGMELLTKMSPVAVDLGIRTAFTDNHPSNYARINRLRKMADEQKERVTVQPNVTLSKNGLGLGFTVNIG